MRLEWDHKEPQTDTHPAGITLLKSPSPASCSCQLLFQAEYYVTQGVFISICLCEQQRNIILDLSVHIVKKTGQRTCEQLTIMLAFDSFSTLEALSCESDSQCLIKMMSSDWKWGTGWGNLGIMFQLERNEELKKPFKGKSTEILMEEKLTKMRIQRAERLSNSSIKFNLYRDVIYLFWQLMLISVGRFTIILFVHWFCPLYDDGWYGGIKFCSYKKRNYWKKIKLETEISSFDTELERYNNLLN